MRILIIDTSGESLALAQAAVDNFHDVDLYINPDVLEADFIGRGFSRINKVKEWQPNAGKADLILTTVNNMYLPQLERFRKKGIPVYAPSQACADLEIKREHGLKFFEKYNLPVPEYQTLNSIEEAEQYVLENPDEYVFKTMGDAEDKSLSFVANSPEQMVQQLRMFQKQGIDPGGKVLLQKKIEGIAEMSVSSWLGPNGFNGPFIHCWEHKKLMNDEKGPNTGEMGSILQVVDKSKLADAVLKPIESALAEMGAFCNFDLNTIIDKHGQPWILEATARFGWPSTCIELELFEGDPFEQLVAVCDGKDEIKMKHEFGIGVVLAIPDFPSGEFDEDKEAGLPIYGITPENVEHVHPQFVMMGEYLNSDMKEEEGWVSAGNYVAVVTDKSDTIEGARSKVYSTVKALSLSNAMYRTDIGSKVERALPELQKLGFIES